MAFLGGEQPSNAGYVTTALVLPKATVTGHFWGRSFLRPGSLAAHRPCVPDTLALRPPWSCEHNF